MLLAVAALISGVAIWHFWSSPDSYVRIAIAAVTILGPFVAAYLFRRKSPALEAADRQRDREGLPPLRRSPKGGEY